MSLLGYICGPLFVLNCSSIGSFKKLAMLVPHWPPTEASGCLYSKAPIAQSFSHNHKDSTVNRILQSLINVLAYRAVALKFYEFRCSGEPRNCNFSGPQRLVPIDLGVKTRHLQFNKNLVVQEMKRSSHEKKRCGQTVRNCCYHVFLVSFHFWLGYPAAWDLANWSLLIELYSYFSPCSVGAALPSGHS